MTFMPSPSARLVPGLGRDGAKIAIVGDYTSPHDDRVLKPFQGPAGTILQDCLHAAGLIRGELYLTNVFKSKSKRPGKFANTDFFNEDKKAFTELGLEHAEMLRLELNHNPANVIVAAGLPALMALTNYNSVAKYRGYVCETTKLERPRKIIPTYSFLSTVRSYTNRHVIVADLTKVKKESAFPEIVRPERQLVFNFDTVEEVLEWLEFYNEQEEVAFDIEVINHELASISFSHDPKLAVAIPIGACNFRNEWTEMEELQIWRGVQRVLGNERIKKVAQNSIFDIHFLATKCGIIVRGEVRDSMIAHHVIWPDLPKGLGFLGSVYCGSQEYWKDAVKFNNIKDES